MTDQGTPGASPLASASPSAGVPPSTGVSASADVPSATRIPPRSGGSLTASGLASDDVAATAGGPGVDPAIGPIVVSEADLQRRVGELGEQITADYAGRPPLLVGVLKGACFFLSDLARAIDLPVEIDFMAVSSYGSATRTSGVVRIVKDLELDLTGRHVLIVEDIVDSGPHPLLPAAQPGCPPPGLARGGRPADQGGTAVGRPRPGLRGLSHPSGVRGRVRARRGRALPQSPVRRRCTGRSPMNEAGGYPGALHEAEPHRTVVRSPITYVALAASSPCCSSALCSGRVPSRTTLTLSSSSTT